MKVRAKALDDEQRMETLDALYTAAGSLHGREAMKAFLRDLLTESERIMLGRRILIARKLLVGTPALQIAEELGMGLDTVYKVESWLDDQIPGYENAIAGMEKAYEKRTRKLDDAKRFATLKRKYPLHFLFFPWPKGFKPK